MIPTQDSGPSPKLRQPSKDESRLFQACLEPLTTICRPPLDAKQVIGYFNALGDLPAEVVFAAASEIAGYRQYPTWPTPGEIRSVGAKILSPQLTHGEAWLIALTARERLADPSIDYKNGIPVAEFNQRIWAALPPAIAVTLRIFGGWRMPGDGNTYSRFRDEYERQVVICRRPFAVPAESLKIARQVVLSLADQLARNASLPVEDERELAESMLEKVYAR